MHAITAALKRDGTRKNKQKSSATKHHDTKKNETSRRLPHACYVHSLNWCAACCTRHVYDHIIPVHVVGEAGDHVFPEVVVNADGRGLALHEPHLRIALELAWGINQTQSFNRSQPSANHNQSSRPKPTIEALGGANA